MKNPTFCFFVYKFGISRDKTQATPILLRLQMLAEF